MAERTRRRNSREKSERKTVDLSGFDWKINRAHQFDNGNISFDLELTEGLTLYRLCVVKTRDNREFISFPQYQSNGKWYNYSYLALTDKDQDTIIDEVYKCIDY